MDEAIKNLGPSAAAVLVMWFMLQWLIRRMDAGDASREAYHREFIQVLTTTIVTNTSALSSNAIALERLTNLLINEREENRRDRETKEDRKQQ